jgi:DNA invertase Pin-like site-specific DNA recombinase
MSGKRVRSEVGNDVYAGFVRRIVRAFGRRIGAGDVAALSELEALRRELDATIHGAVVELRADGYSWQQLADVLGVSRQAVMQRFPEAKGVGRQAGGQPGHLR